MKTIAFLPRVIGAAWPKPLLLKRPWARQAASTIGGDDPDGGSPDPNSPLDDCYAAVRSGSTGLMSAEARIRLRINGFNEVSHEKAPHWLRQLVSAFNNPFIWVLFALATISYLSDPNDLKPVIIVSVMVGLSVVLRFWQEFRSSRTAEALKAMVSNTATVARRDHPASAPRQQEVPMQDLVVGDVVHLSAGDMVPADLRLISSRDLFVSQAILTGEPLPIEKYDTLAL